MNRGEHLLAREPVGHAFAKLAVPTLLSTLVSTIYNLTDTYFIGLLRDAAQLAAISAAMPAMWIASAVCGVLAAGAPQLISMKAGKGDSGGVQRCASLCVFGTLALSLVLTPPALWSILPALRAMGADGAILTHSSEYLQIVLAATAVSSTAGALQGVLRALGRASRASIGSMAGIAANILLDPLLILGLDMGMLGAALATALGSAVSLAVSALFASREISPRRAMPPAQEVRQILLIALAPTLSSIVTALTVACAFRAATNFGDSMMSSISVCSKIYSVFVSIVSALAFSMQPFIGYNHASGDHARLRRGMLLSLAAGSAVCLLGSASFLLFGAESMRIFSDDETIIASGGRMLRCFAVGLPFAALLMNALSYLSATGRAVQSLVVSMGRQLVLFIPSLVLLQRLLGSAGLMLAYPVTDALSAVPALLFCLRDPALRPHGGKNHA